jgi:hypothetical protein
LLNRVQQQAKARPDVANVVAFLRRRVPPGAPIGLVGSEETLDYPLFGPRLERRVVRFGNPDEVTPARMRREGLAGVLFSDVGTPPPRLPSIPVPNSSAFWAPSEGR